jgi:hypothetical protein
MILMITWCSRPPRLLDEYLRVLGAIYGLKLKAAANKASTKGS